MGSRSASFEEWQLRANAAHRGCYSYLELFTKNNKPWLKIVCKFHGEFTQNASSHVSGRGCPKCGAAKRALSNRPTLDALKAKCREVHGDIYEYLSVEVKNQKTFLRILCPMHGEFTQTANNHLNKHGCPACGNRRMLQRQPDSFEDFRTKALEVHEGKYSYISVFRKTCSSSPQEVTRAWMRAVCPVHGEFEQNCSDHLTGSGCPHCGVVARTESVTYTLDEFRDRAASVRDFVHSDLKILAGPSPRTVSFSCQLHGRVTRTLNNYLKGLDCPKCSRRVTKPNLEIQKFLTDSGIGAELEVSIPGTKLTMDVYVESRKVGIEYHGNIWHSTKFKERPDIHAERLRKAEEQGIRLIQIFSDEWTYRKDACKLLIGRLCGAPERKLHARSCEVLPVDRQVAKIFLDTWHVQGAPQSGEFLGLFAEGCLVGIAAFSNNTSHRSKQASLDRVELVRYATSCSVRGGFSRLLKAWCRGHQATREVVTYSDKRLFQGNMYAACGFTRDGDVAIDYRYLDTSTDKRIHKSVYQKSRLHKLMGEEYDAAKTEEVLTRQCGLYRIYDCGKVRWLYTV